MSEAVDTYFLRAFYSGRVQGVGFRYSVSQIAKGYEVTGFVRNLIDGRVELEIEGSEKECQAMADMVEDEMDAYVRKVERSDGRRERSFTRFEISG